MNLTDKLQKINQTQKSKEEEKQKRRSNANKNRSQKMRRSWNYFKAIQKNYDTKKSLKEIRSDFTKMRKGLEYDIQDVIWRNPSP